MIEERKHLINENWQPIGDARAMLRRNESSADPRSSSSMVEKERQRLEVLKRRQEKELQQMVQYEVTRKVRFKGRDGSQSHFLTEGLFLYSLQGRDGRRGGNGALRVRSTRWLSRSCMCMWVSKCGAV